MLFRSMGALFDNITKSTSQAARAMDVAKMSAEDLANVSNKELSTISESTSVKFQAAMEQLKISIAPLGEAFLKGITPVVNMVTKIADAFNNLPDGVKNSVAVITALVAGLGPVLLMTIGLIGNGLANIIKTVQFFRKSFAKNGKRYWHHENGYDETCFITGRNTQKQSRTILCGTKC